MKRSEIYRSSREGGMEFPVETGKKMYKGVVEERWWVGKRGEKKRGGDGE